METDLVVGLEIEREEEKEKGPSPIRRNSKAARGRILKYLIISYPQNNTDILKQKQSCS